MLSKSDKTIGVIAGTPVDTRMGVDFIQKKGLAAVGVPTASGPEEQNLLQFLHPDALVQKVISIIDDLEKQGINKVMIYCNSLAAAIDLELVKRSHPGTSVVTPLDIYRSLASRYKRLMLWAANGQCLAGIEKIFYERNPAVQILGISMLPVVIAIENLEPPEFIIEKYELAGLLPRSLEVDGLVLGCTHLPYLKQVLQERTNIPVIDPADEMLAHLLHGGNKRV